MKTSQRTLAWRNLIVAAANAALEQGLFAYPEKQGEPAADGAVFDFSLAPARVFRANLAPYGTPLGKHGLSHRVPMAPYEHRGP